MQRIGLASLALVACNPLLDLQGYAYLDGAPATGGQGAGGGEVPGGSGGVAGDGGTMGSGASVSDWSGSMAALYLFEEAGSLGVDDVGDHHLVSHSGPTLDGGTFIEGGASLATHATGWLDTAVSSDFQVGSGAITWGAWLWMATSSPPAVLSVMTLYDPANTVGWGAEIFLSEPNCFIGTGSMWLNCPASTMQANTWVHLTCTYDPGDETLQTFRDGTLGNDRVGTIVETPTSFSVSHGNEPFDGNIDEVFFTRGALDASSIHRIWACGVEGTQCVCASDGASYQSCGRAEPDCSALPPCNKPSP